MKTRRTAVKKHTAALALLAVAMLQAGCSSLHSTPGNQTAEGQVTQAVWSKPGRKDFQRAAYAVLGGGQSRLEPDTSGAAGVDVNDRYTNAGQISIGADLSRQLSVEAHAADLGSAGLSANGGSGGRVEYQMYGASALLYAGKNRHRFKREGLTGYARLGVGVMENNAIGTARFRAENDTNLLVGAGVEYMSRLGLGLRAEAISFDEDARYAQLGLVYRMGKRKERQREQVAAVDSSVAPLTPSSSALAVTPRDEQQEVVPFTGVSEVVNFATDSSKLTAQTMDKLDAVVKALNNQTDVILRISGHADSSGPADYNQKLSQRRAEAVAAYLQTSGIKQSQLIAEGFGELRPVSSNVTKAGRQQNRRVDLQAE